jgi:hypothetical protein
MSGGAWRLISKRYARGMPRYGATAAAAVVVALLAKATGNGHV